MRPGAPYRELRCGSRLRIEKRIADEGNKKPLLPGVPAKRACGDCHAAFVALYL
jgi:hypothetical protein